MRGGSANQEQQTKSKRGRGQKWRDREGDQTVFLPRGPLLAHLLLIPRVILDLGIDGDFHIESTIVVIWDDVAVLVDMFALGVNNAALGIAVDLDALLTDLTDGVGLVGVRVNVENRVSGVSGVGAGSTGASSGRVGTRVGTRERSTGNERTTDGENDAHGHGGGENSGHAKVRVGVRTAPGSESG